MKSKTNPRMLFNNKNVEILESYNYNLLAEFNIRNMIRDTLLVEKGKREVAKTARKFL